MTVVPRATLVGVALAILSLLASPALSNEYWIAYEGNDLPENVGWTRYWGNWQGEYQGPGAYRTIQDGIITYDSLYDDGVYDFNYIQRPQATDPRPGELFVMEWRLRVDEVRGRWDPGVTIFSDTGRAIDFTYGANYVESVFDPTLYVPIAPGVLHSYRMESPDMLTYTFYIDGQLAHSGPFWQAASKSYMAWGDGVEGAASVHDWDYVRFGVIPEPDGLFSALIGAACCVGGRRAPRSGDPA